MRTQSGHDPFDLDFEADDDFGPARDDGWRSAGETGGRGGAAVDPFADLAPAAPRARGA
jgi:pilus assembly protein CpaE